MPSWSAGASVAKTGSGNKANNGSGFPDGVSFHAYWHPEWGYSDTQSVFTGKPATAGSDTATTVIYDGATSPAPSALPGPAMTVNMASAPSLTVDPYSFAVLVFGP